MSTTLYPGIPFSPQAALSNNIGAADTIIKVTDISAFPDAPNLATIGTDEDGETVLYTAKTAEALSGCVRGVEGAARAWNAGETIGRNFTAKDHADLIAAIREAQNAASGAQPLLTGRPGQVVGFDDDGAAVAQDAPDQADAVTVPGGGVMEMGQELGDGPYTFELTEDGETAVSAEQVSYDGAQSGLQAETAQGAVDELGARIARMSGVSLVDNGYFADPINQLGKTEYAGGGYTIDRFLTDGLTVTLEDGWLKLQNKTEAAHYFVQNKDPNQFKWIVKERVTQSLLYKDNTPGCAVYWGYSADGAEFTSAVYAILPDGEGEKLYCGTSDVLPGVTTVSQWQTFGLSVPPGGMCRLKAAKLELGPVQTLAHKEGDNWVLNDPPPDKALELLKCRRYMFAIENTSGANPGVGWGVVNDSSTIAIDIPVPISMRIAPAVKMSGGWFLLGLGLSFEAESRTIHARGYSQNTVSIAITGFSGLETGKAVSLIANNDPTAKIIFDANLM